MAGGGEVEVPLAEIDPDVVVCKPGDAEDYVVPSDVGEMAGDSFMMSGDDQAY